MIEAMKQALEALKRLNDIDGMYSWVDTEQALRQAIAQAKKQEPVAYIDHVSGKPKFINGYVVQTDYDIPLYTAPPKREWVGLTDAEILDLWIANHKDTGATDAFARAIEAKLKEKNT
jgi:hypothetical protein